MPAHELPPPMQMMLLLGGFRISQALYAAATLGVADQLAAAPPRRTSWPNIPAPIRRPCADCSARWPAWACSPNPSPASSP